VDGHTLVDQVLVCSSHRGNSRQHGVVNLLYVLEIYSGNAESLFKDLADQLVNREHSLLKASDNAVLIYRLEANLNGVLLVLVDFTDDFLNFSQAGSKGRVDFIITGSTDELVAKIASFIKLTAERLVVFQLSKFFRS